MNLKTMQKKVYNNKVTHGFNIDNIEKEFLFLYGEIAEAFEAYKNNNRTALAEEMADIAIYLLGLSEILHIDLEEEIIKKMSINEKREYKIKDNGYAERL